MHDYESTRASWDKATRNHNAHKGDQVTFLRDGGDVLFPDTSLRGRAGAGEGANEIPATAWQHGVGQIVDALIQAGLVLETLREYPYANGCRTHARRPVR